MADPLQTTYGTRIAAAFAGMLANESNRDTDSKTLQSATCGFGLAVSQGTDDETCVLGIGSGATFLGISRANPTLSHHTADRYEEGDEVGVLRRGDIWVSPDAAVDAGDAVYANETTGRLRGGAAGGYTILPGSRWRTSAEEDGLAIVTVDRSKNAADA